MSENILHSIHTYFRFCFRKGQPNISSRPSDTWYDALDLYHLAVFLSIRPFSRCLGEGIRDIAFALLFCPRNPTFYNSYHIHRSNILFVVAQSICSTIISTIRRILLLILWKLRIAFLWCLDKHLCLIDAVQSRPFVWTSRWNMWEVQDSHKPNAQSWILWVYETKTRCRTIPVHILIPTIVLHNSPCNYVSSFNHLIAWNNRIQSVGLCNVHNYLRYSSPLLL